MSDKMRPIPFKDLMNWVLREYESNRTVFGVNAIYRHQGDKALPIFGEKIETPFGPAAGPHSQLSQNLIAAYASGARFFELKTVQILDGEDLPVEKPCILAQDECYNVEWSTELYVPQAYDEYVKGWFALKLLSREWGLGSPDGFVFNMSVGYDLKGIQSEKIDRFIQGLKNAKDTPIWQECVAWAKENTARFKHVDEAFINSISDRVCRSITLSTLHGCPPDEIERIARYLITEKGLNTFIKCNPTLLGYEFARQRMDEMGYDYLVFDDHHFKNDLQFADAVPMFKRLQGLCDERGLAFGVKLTNTFPVRIPNGELPGEEMYMSGKSLYPLSIALSEKLSAAFDGKMRISYSGGADQFNIRDIFNTGIWPITMATTLLKPGGYNRLQPIAELFTGAAYSAFEKVDTKQVAAISQRALKDAHHVKPIKPIPVRKVKASVPLASCFMAPCEAGCPIGQDIPAYLELVAKGEMAKALEVILNKNPLPFMTGTICSHRCMASCTRHFYEEPVAIRAAKLEAAQGGYEEVLHNLAAGEKRGENVAIIGGGPGGMAAAHLLAREGAGVTLYEKRDALGGIVRHVIPGFRIADEAIEKDAAMLGKLGVKVLLNTEAPSAEQLFAQGFTHIILAVGAWKPGELKLEKGQAMNVLHFLETQKKEPDALTLGKNVVVVGGGNTAMDAARAAKRLKGVKNVSLVYRRTKREMPADAEELELAVYDGVIFKELLAPVAHENGQLVCDVMRLGLPDGSGRRSPEKTGETVKIPADTVISAVGEKIETEHLQNNGVVLGANGKPESLENGCVYVIGDALRGPATVVEGIKDATLAVEAILNVKPKDTSCVACPDEIKPLRNSLSHEGNRCLKCAAVCENCVDVCPNRANIAVKVPGLEKEQVVHIDRMCNECGNCTVFCPYDSSPYKEKLTVFAWEEDFENSQNQGFLVLNDGKVKLRLTGTAQEQATMKRIIQTVIDDYAWCL